jgi:2-(1,2-epoxy-1,2-dihydrophenyl)acetyl-CoA isomerase
VASVITESLDGRLLTISLNRPERRNALSAELCEALLDALRRAQYDRQVGAVLLRGEGGTFCVGGDVKGFASGAGSDIPTVQRENLLRRNMEASRLLHDMRKPTVAAISGAAAGAGLALALACDLRVAGRTAKITTAFAKVGLPGDYGGTYFLTQLLGSAKARELFLLCPVLSGEEAHAAGLVTRVVDDAEVDSAAREMAASLADGPLIALGYMKQNLNLAEHADLGTLLDAEAQHQTRSMLTDDHKEASRAFVEKRMPEFQGK